MASNWAANRMRIKQMADGAPLGRGPVASFDVEADVDTVCATARVRLERRATGRISIAVER
jgi:hypothetical protein